MESYVERFAREQKEKEARKGNPSGEIRSGKIPSEGNPGKQKDKQKKVSRKDGENDGKNTRTERHEAQKAGSTREQTQ